MNLQLAFNILNALYQRGVRTFCIAPGGRNAPFVEILSRCSLPVFYFYDERSMAFFAHGRSRRDKKPVAVITTSGTAACELLPAVVESHYSSSSLVLVTADRPKKYKGTGAPQVIEQEGIFSHYVSLQKSLDVQNLQNSISFSDWNIKDSIHINVHFDEPLLEEQVLENEVSNWIQKNWSVDSSSSQSFEPEISMTPSEKDDLWMFFQSSSQPVILVSSIPYEWINFVEKLLLFLNCPVYLEPLSQLRESPKLQHLALKSGDSIFQKAFDQKLFDGVIRIGGIPVSRFWRDLNEWNVPVLSLSLSSLPGLKNRSKALPLLPFLKEEILESLMSKNQISISSSHQEDFLNLDSANIQKPTLEGEWIQWISKTIPESSFVFLGNSLPIAEWNMFAQRGDKNFRYSGNRGANGIDGILSSFIGECRSDVPNYCILGDLSALYDFSAPWILKQMEQYLIRIIVINNFGGQIFKSKFQNPVFLNSHQLEFSHFARMWNLPYQKITQQSESLENKPHLLIEIPIGES